ncbi:MAG: ArnT family glycosyltransferase [Candidatus Binatia bacterium]
MKQRTVSGDLLVPAAVFLAAFGYYYLFRRLGWFIEDEGVLYYHYLRVYHGQLPYRDFFTGYPPMPYYLHAALFSLCGVSITATRVFMGVMNALTCAGLYAVTRRLASRWFALIPPALFLVMQPGDILNMDFHNSPYPSWEALTFTIWGVWAVLRVLESAREWRRVGWLMLAGVCGALTLLSKQNAGVFFLWALTGFLVSCPVPGPLLGQPEPVVSRVLRAGYLALIPLSCAVLVRDFAGPVTLLLFVAPCAVLALLGARQRFGPMARHRLIARLAAVGVAAVAVAAPWVIYFTSRMGLGPFLRAVFLTGADVAQNLYVPFPPPQPLTLAVVVVALGVWGARGWLAGDGWGAGKRSRRRVALAATLIVGFTGAIIASRLGSLKDLVYVGILGDIYIFMGAAVDNLAAYLVPLVLGTGLVVAWRHVQGRLGESDPRPEGFLCVLWFAACNFILYYPRMDAAHLMSAMPLVYVVGAAILPRARSAVASAFSRVPSRRTRLTFNVACVVLVTGVVGLESAPRLYSDVRVAYASGGLRLETPPREWLRFARADLYFPAYVDEQRRPVQAFRELIDYLLSTTRDGEPIFAFPAMPMVYFITGRDNPTRQDYFLGDNVSFRQQLEVIRTLEDERVRTVVIPASAADYFAVKSRDFTRIIWAYLQRRYYLERRFGLYEVLHRHRDSAAPTAQ